MTRERSKMQDNRLSRIPQGIRNGEDVRPRHSCLNQGNADKNHRNDKTMQYLHTHHASSLSTPEPLAPPDDNTGAGSLKNATSHALFCLECARDMRLPDVGRPVTVNNR